MKKLLFGLLTASAGLLSLGSASAQGTLYTVTGTFPANEPTSTYSAPNGPFTLTFLLPAPAKVPDSEVPRTPFHGYVPIHAGSYTFNGTTTAFTGGTYRRDETTEGNEFDVTLTTASGLAFTLYSEGNSYLTPTGFSGGGLELSVQVQSTQQAATLNSGVVKGVTVNGTTVDVLGYYAPSGVPLTQLSDVNATFQVEYTIPNPSPSPNFAYFLYGSVTFEGVTHPCDVSLSYYYQAPGFEAIVCATNVGLMEFYTISASHTPVLSRFFGGPTTAPVGALGPGHGWALYSNVGPTPFSIAVSLPQFVARPF